MGVRGRFMFYAAGAIGLSFLGGVLGNIFLGKVSGIIIMAGVLGLGYGIIILKQKQGLHSKQRYRGIIIYKNLYKH